LIPAIQQIRVAAGLGRLVVAREVGFTKGRLKELEQLPPGEVPAEAEARILEAITRLVARREARRWGSSDENLLRELWSETPDARPAVVLNGPTDRPDRHYAELFATETAGRWSVLLKCEDTGRATGFGPSVDLNALFDEALATATVWGCAFAVLPEALPKDARS